MGYNIGMDCPGLNCFQYALPYCGKSFFICEKFHNVKTGALRGLIGKTGAKPARSRHCNGERTHETPLGRKSWEGLGEQRSVSQENYLFESHRYYLRAMGRRLRLCVLPTSGVDRFPSIAEAFFYFVGWRSRIRAGCSSDQAGLSTGPGGGRKAWDRFNTQKEDESCYCIETCNHQKSKNVLRS